jgi:predicted NAD/FAD-binding protein
MSNKSAAKIAVIGGGIAGLTAAYLLGDQYRVTLYDRQEHLGGDVHTVFIPEGPSKSLPIDVGFSVFNEHNYPTFMRLLKRLEIAVQNAETSFSYMNLNDNFYYSTKSIPGLFAQGGHFLSPSFYKFLLELKRFNRRMACDYKEQKLKNLTVGDFLGRGNFPNVLTDYYLLPLRALVWPLSLHESLTNCPAESLAGFLLRQGVIEADTPRRWLSIPGGSFGYVNAILKSFKGEVKKQTEVQSVRRTLEKVLVKEKHGEETLFDYAVIATHADEALVLLEDPTAEERRLLSPWKYTKCVATLHTDDSLMPPRPCAWASWNMRYGRRGHDADIDALTCHMNRLQRLKTNHQYFVTLNSPRSIAPDKRLKEVEFKHPVFSPESLGVQPQLQKLNGANTRTFFCGSYFGAGFHEEALCSTLEALRTFCPSL